MQSLLAWPIQRIDDHADLDLPSGRYTYNNPGNTIRVVLDAERFEFYIEILLDTDPSLIENVLNRLIFPMGFELLEEGEADEPADDEDYVRIGLVPIFPINNLAEQHAEAGFVKAGVLASVAAALVAVPAINYGMTALLGAIA